MGIRIVTDSTSEIGREEASRLGITVVPLKTIFQETEYLDGVDLTPEAFFEKLAASKELPTTSQPSPFDFELAFREAQEGGNQIIVICLAERISGTCQSARIAAENCEGDIWVIDSETSSLGVHILVKRAVQLIGSGKPIQEIVRLIEEEKKQVRLFAVLDTLEYLHKGGRLSRTSAMAGSLLHLKPIISITHGEIKLSGKCLGMKKAHAELFKFVESEGGIDYTKPFAIGYTGMTDRFDQFKQVCEQRLDGNTPIERSVGGILGTHVGPGAVAITFFTPGNQADGGLHVQ